jgi:hypothetical protein
MAAVLLKDNLSVENVNNVPVGNSSVSNVGSSITDAINQLWNNWLDLRCGMLVYKLCEKDSKGNLIPPLAF